MIERDLVVGESNELGNEFRCVLIVLPRSIALDLAEKVRVLRCGTWGAIREAVAPELYKEVLQLAGYGTFEDFAKHLSIGRPVPGALENAEEDFEQVGPDLPSDDDPFDAYRDVSAVADGDWPMAIQRAMFEYLPRDIVEQYGKTYETTFNGTFTEFDAQDRGEIIRTLERAGFTCSEDPELIAQFRPQ